MLILKLYSVVGRCAFQDRTQRLGTFLEGLLVAVVEDAGQRLDLLALRGLDRLLGHEVLQRLLAQVRRRVALDDATHGGRSGSILLPAAWAGGVGSCLGRVPGRGRCLGRPAAAWRGWAGGRRHARGRCGGSAGRGRFIVIGRILHASDP